MNIHTLNDLAGNNNNGGNNYQNNQYQNNQNQNNQIFMAGFNPENGGQNSIMDLLFPRSVYKIKTISFLIICIITAVYLFQLFLYYSIYKPKGYNWGCLLYHLGASELSSIANHYQYFRLITPIFTHNNFGHLFSNAISIVFIGFPVEYDLKNRTNYILLFLISGIIGNFCSLLFTYENISMGASGAILGLCAYYVLYFILNWEQMNYNQKCCSMIFFIIIFLNLTSGVSEGSSAVDVHSHIGGFLGGLAFSMFLTYRSQVLYRFPQQLMKFLFYLSIGFLIGIPLISAIVINLKEVPDNCEFICLSQNM
jgi:rhomboid protease GluP